MDRIDLYSKITDNYNKAKAYYQKLLLNDMKNFIRNSNSSPENFHINNSMIPKEFQTHLNLQKAKKSVFFDDFETKKTTNNEKIINSNMFSSTINNFQQEEEKNINPKMMNSTFVNHPIFEENSENNSDKEEENDRTSVINLLTFGESIKRKKTLSVIFEKGQKHINKRGDLVREEIRNAANDQVRKLEELELKLQALVT